MPENNSDESNWSSLPPELVEAIGAGLTDGRHVQAASLVCRSWQSSIEGGVRSLEVDMHSDPSHWGNKLPRLSSMLRSLQAITVYVNTTVPRNVVCSNLEMLTQMSSLQELHLRLSARYELQREAAQALGSLHHLAALTLCGGGCAPGALLQMLQGLAQGGGRLRVLSMAPSATGAGLGDEELECVAQLRGLQSLEFKAFRLTSRGIDALSSLPQVQRLTMTSMEADVGYQLSQLRRMASLKHLTLSLDHGDGGSSSSVAAATAAAAAAGRDAAAGTSSTGSAAGGTGSTHVVGSSMRQASGPQAQLHELMHAPAQSVSLHFKWSDRVANLMRACHALLANLTQLDVGLCRVTSEEVFKAVSELTRLKGLRMTVYSNADARISCQLAHFSSLTALQSFQLAKQAAYFPEHRRFCPSSISIPLTPHTLDTVARQWGARLRVLRLAVALGDIEGGALDGLGALTALKVLSLSVEGGCQASVLKHPSLNEQQQQQQTRAAGSGGENHQDQEHAAGGGSEDPTAAAADAAAASAAGGAAADAAGAGAAEARGPVGRAGSGSFAVVRLHCLPSHLTQLELTSVVLDLHVDVLSAHPSLLSHLNLLELDHCLLREHHLAALCPRLSRGLSSLRLLHVLGLTNEALSHLSHLVNMTSLAVVAPTNAAVTQSALAPLSRLTQLKYLSWESDDLTNLGPSVPLFSPFTALRSLVLSCTRGTMARACGGPVALQWRHMPYAHIDTLPDQV